MCSSTDHHSSHHECISHRNHNQFRLCLTRETPLNGTLEGVYYIHIKVLPHFQRWKMNLYHWLERETVKEEKTALEEQRKAAKERNAQIRRAGTTLPWNIVNIVGIGSSCPNFFSPKNHKRWLQGQTKVRLEEAGCKENSSSWQSELHCIFYNLSRPGTANKKLSKEKPLSHIDTG